MAFYNYRWKRSSSLIKKRYTACFNDIFKYTQDLESLSIYTFPKGAQKDENTFGGKIHYGYGEEGTIGELLQKFDTVRKSGVKQWSDFLAVFVPGTSFVPHATMKTPIIENAPMCKFTIKNTPNIFVSALMKQIWINGVRYAWENPYTVIPKFCLTYWNKSMTPLETFNLFVLAHFYFNGTFSNHSCHFLYSLPYTQEQYEEILSSKKDGSLGTSSLRRKLPIDPKTYLDIKDPNIQELHLLVKKTCENIEDGKNIPSLSEIFALWKKIS